MNKVLSFFIFITILWPNILLANFDSSVDGEMVFYNINITDMKKAKSFFTKLFDWEVTDVNSNMAFIVLSGKVVGSLMKAPSELKDKKESAVLFFNVRDLGQTIKLAKEMGAILIVPPTPFSGGHFAELMAPMGPVFGISSYD